MLYHRSTILHLRLCLTIDRKTRCFGGKIQRFIFGSQDNYPPVKINRRLFSAYQLFYWLVVQFKYKPVSEEDMGSFINSLNQAGLNGKKNVVILLDKNLNRNNFSQNSAKYITNFALWRKINNDSARLEMA